LEEELTMIEAGIRQHRIRRAAATATVAAAFLGAGFVTSAHAGQVGHAAANTPTYGGSYSIRTGDAADCLDPQKTASGVSNEIDSYVFDPLLSIDKKGHYVGNLAPKYSVADGGKRLTFRLRQNVRFSNGDPLTASDVKFTFDRALNPATASPVAASQLAAIGATKVVNKYTVELDLKTPNRPLLTNLAGSYTGILDSKWMRAHADSTCNKPVGSGPYMIRSAGAAFSDVVLVANKRHNFGPSWVTNKGVPYITTVHFKAITSDATAISELLSGGVDYTTIPGTQLSRVRGKSSLVLHKLRSQSVTFVEFNAAKPPFNDPQVRKAFAEVINRKNIVQAALGGLGQPINGPLAPGIPFYDKSASKYMPKYNLSAASKIITAKHATGPYTYLTVGIPDLSTQAEILQQAAGQAGMQLNIVTKSGVGDFVSAAAKGDFDVLSLSATYTDPDILYLLLDSSQGGGKGLNWTGVTDLTLDSLLQQGRTTLAKKKIGAIYAKAQVQINKDLYFVGVVAPTGILAIRSTIKGYHVDAAGASAIQDMYIKTK